jgi:hypothetical protein
MPPGLCMWASFFLPTRLSTISGERSVDDLCRVADLLLIRSAHAREGNRPLKINYGKLRTHSYRRLWTTRPLAVECARGWGGKINVFTIARKGSIALFHHRREGNPCQPSCQKMTDFAQS